MISTKKTKSKMGGGWWKVKRFIPIEIKRKRKKRIREKKEGKSGNGNAQRNAFPEMLPKKHLQGNKGEKKLQRQFALALQ